MALIIGDIHGCLFQLKSLLDYAQPHSEQMVITLGDYIDRGPESKGVLDYLIELKKSQALTTIKGNHDVFLEDALRSPAMSKFWTMPQIGGKTTLASYGNNLDNVPNSHWNFLSGAPLWYEGEDFIGVHGGVNAQLPMHEQKPEVLMNQRFEHAAEHCSGKLVICGHTRQINGVPSLNNNTLCIDTNVFAGGYLTAYDTEKKEFYQVNARGERKSFSMAELQNKSTP